MKYSGTIKKLDHIVVSDPSYDKKVNCRYEYENINGKDWLVNLDINIRNVYYNQKYVGKTINYLLTLRKDKEHVDFDEFGKIIKLHDIRFKEFDIGCDTACVAFGINDNAKEILNSKDEWQPSCALKTGGDGMVATVVQGKNRKELLYFQLRGEFDEDFINEEELLNYLVNQFEITELVKKEITTDIEKEEINL